MTREPARADTVWTNRASRLAIVLCVGVILVVTSIIVKTCRDNRTLEESRLKHALRQASLPCSDHMFATYGWCDYPSSCNSRDDVIAMLAHVYQERGRSAFMCPISGEPYRFNPDPCCWSRSGRCDSVILCHDTHGGARPASVVTVWGRGGQGHVNINIDDLPNHEWIKCAVTVTDVETALSSPAARR